MSKILKMRSEGSKTWDAKIKKILVGKSAEICRLKNVIDNLPGSIYWKNKKGVYLGRNTYSLEKMKGVKLENNGAKDDVVGKTDYDFFSKEVADQYRKHDLEVMESGQEMSLEEHVTLPNGEVITQLSTKRPLYDAEGKIDGVVGNTVDITYLKKIEQELRNEKERAEVANKAKAEFLENQYDLIFMDIGLPDMDGYEVTKRIRLNELNMNHIPIIALTAHVDEDNKQHCISSGMNAVLSKPLIKEKAEDILNSFIPHRKSKLELNTVTILEEEISADDKVIDFEFVKKQFGENTVIEMLNMLIDGFPKDLADLKAAHDDKNWITVKDLTHKLKGGASYCGTIRLEKACFNLENYVRAAKTDLYEESYNQLLREILAVEEAVKK